MIVTLFETYMLSEGRYHVTMISTFPDSLNANDARA